MSKIVRRNGKSRYKEYDSAGTISEGDAVQFDENGEVVVAAHGKAVVGVAVNDATSSTTCVVDIVDSGSEWEIPIEDGTMTAAEVGEEAKFNSADGATLTEDGDASDDFIITGWDGVSTDKFYGVFKKLAFGETTNAA